MYGLTYETISLPIAIHFVIPASACSLVTFIIETCKMSDSRIILAPLVLMNCIIQALSFLNNTTFRDLWDGLKFDMTSFLNINQKNIYGNTLLHMAIHRSDFSMVQRLNNKGANFAILCDANEDLQQASITPLDLVIEKLSFATLHPEHHSSAEISTVDPKIVSFLYPLAARNYSKNREEYMNMLSRIINPDKHKSKFPLDICHLIYSYSQNKINFDYTSNEILQRRIIRNKEIGEALSQSMLLKYHLLSKVKLK